MKHGLWPTLALLAIGFVPGLLLAGGGGYWKVMAERAETEAAIEAARQEARAADLLAAALGDSLEVLRVVAAVADARADSAAGAAALWRDRFAGLPRPSPFDTAAWMANLPAFVAGADSALAACDTAIATCHEALAAKDDQIEVADSTIRSLIFARDLHSTRADELAGQWRATQDALASRVRWEKPKMGAAFVAGVGLCYAAMR